jgi:hypothetical protein
VAVRYTSARISVNGQVYTVKRGSVFPKDEQLFEVTSIGASSVVLELTAGEFTNGSSGITLQRGHSLPPLVNQDEGVSYTVKLLSTSAAAG